MGIKEWMQITSMIVTFVVLLLNTFILIYTLVQKSKEPANKIQTEFDEFKKQVEQKFQEYDLHFDKDVRRIEDLEEGSIVMIESVQAILKHSIDGNNIEGLKDADKNIDKYLVLRGRRRV